jgi:tetratricopeptide (TPR) repeat protein
MKRKMRVRRILVLLLVAAIVLLASCATKPAPEQPAQPAQPKPEPKQTVATVALPEKEYAEAKSLKARVDQNGLGEFVPEEYKQAEAKLQEAEGTYNKDNAKAKASLDQAVAAYNTVISKGFPLKTDKSRKDVEAVKANADNLKAPVAMKSEYAAALARYNQALAAQKAGDYERAIDLFGQAKIMFDQVAVKTQEKKATAEAALQAAQNSQADSEQKGNDADAQLKSGQ